MLINKANIKIVSYFIYGLIFPFKVSVSAVFGLWFVPVMFLYRRNLQKSQAQASCTGNIISPY